MSHPINHRPDCAGPDEYAFTGRLGDTVLSCRACKRYRVQTVDGEPRHLTPKKDASPTLEAAPEPEPAVRGMACRPHYRPVNARGRGCAACDREHREAVGRRKKRKGKAAERRAQAANRRRAPELVTE